MAREHQTRQSTKLSWKKNAPFFLIMLAIVAIGVAGMVTSPKSKSSTPPATNATTTTTTETVTTTQPVIETPRGPVEEVFPEGQEPKNNFYDAERDLHWVSAHNHWHPGRPPVTPLGQMPSAQQLPTFTPPNAQSTTSPMNTNQVSQETDREWMDMEYDAVNDRHWHAGHGHFHPGAPPVQ